MTILVRLAVTFVALLGGIVMIAVAVLLYLNGRANGTLTSSGETRTYLVHVPKSYNPSTPAPLVISLHGAYLWPGFQRRLTLWDKLADEQGFIVVYPAATGLPRLWRVAPGPELATETQFFLDLIDHLSAQFNIDSTRVYANGYSNGAAMTFMLSCTLGDRIAAFGMVATPVVPWEWCEDQRPVPMIAFHGTEDTFAPYKGGENWLTTEPLISIEKWTALWGQRNQCDEQPLISQPAADVVLRQYEACFQDAAVAMYAMQGAGHIWPGGTPLMDAVTGPFSDGVDATQEMWTFYKQHPLSSGAH